MSRQTLALIKPDIAKQNLIGTVIQRIEQAGFKIVALKTVIFEQKLVDDFYAEHKNAGFYNDLISFMQSGIVIGLILEKDNAIPAWRDLMGSTDKAKANIGTIRHDFATNITENSVHGSDSEENFLREKGIIFPELS